MKCELCEKPTAIIGKFLGFFGASDVHSRLCRDCLPEEWRAAHDEAVAEEKARRARQKKP